MRILAFSLVLCIACIAFVLGGFFSSPEAEKPLNADSNTCENKNADGTCPSGLLSEKEKKFHPVCGLYMAPSSIPYAGWGMYTNQDLKGGQAIDPLDLAIPVVDFGANYRDNKRLISGHEDLPSWLMHEYYWNADVIYAQFEADSIDGVIPGFGMLANSHVGLINTENIGAQFREGRFRDGPSVGARTEYQDLTFKAIGDIPAGHELFAEYGDEWFEERTYAFGDALPLSFHFENADALLEDWNKTMQGDVDSPLAEELYNVVLEGYGDLFSKRFKTALPDTYKDAKDQLELGTAYATVPDVIRDQKWLEENGMCLDHISPAMSKEVDGERGVFATRKLEKGSPVAPAPLIHFSRKHMIMTLRDAHSEILWRGHQLLLNYCYSHKSTSLLFFPYSPSVNLMNNGGKEKANVGLRWSKKQPKPEMMEWSTERVLEFNKKSGLTMEFYALRDIEEGEEVLIDYGDNWQEAWDRHAFDWRPPVHGGESYKSAWDYQAEPRKAIHTEPGYPPFMVEVRCWVDPDDVSKDAEGWHEWKDPDTMDLDDTLPCVLLARQSQGKEDIFDIQVTTSQGIVKFRNVPNNRITYVDRAYTSNLHLKNAFRHEIELPDEMIPNSWKDLEVPPGNERCGLYLATSSIPNAGLGMYTGKELEEGQRVCDGDVSIQVEDYDLNVKLRHWSNNTVEYDEPKWLMANYFWNPSVTHGLYEADDVESIVPGMGMLANSHTALYNSDMTTTTQSSALHRGRDPGAGGSTHYHDVHFFTEEDLPAGHELFVSYGDDWFNDRDELGPIPLSFHFDQADKTLEAFLTLVNNSIDSVLAKDLWDVLANASTTPKRYNAAFPKDVKDVPRLAKDGTASDALPDRVRSIEWLDKNGRCLDNIRVGQSKIRQAGNGAFATRAIPKGSFVDTLPVVHLRRHSMEIYASDDYDDPEEKVTFDGTQQLLNYCFGVAGSSLLLYPYSPMSNYINHNATRANARLEWSSLPNHEASWLERTPDDLDKETHSGLIMDLVATRDIKAGEEIYLDYGSDWESAWESHVKTFKPDDDAVNYVSATQLNERMEWILTRAELEQGGKYSFDFGVIQTVCYVGKPYTGARGNGTLPTYNWAYVRKMYNDASYGFPCDVIQRNSIFPQLDDDRRDAAGPRVVSHTYSAVVYGHFGHFNMNHIPRKAIHFRDAPYRSDFAFRKGFRHEMHLPRSMYPEAWFDVDSTGTSKQK